MLRNLTDLKGYAILATDGAIGHVTDFYFDDEAWVIRYLVVDTGTWLSSRKVLISPIAIGHPDWTEKVLPVAITKEQVKNSPEIDTHKPVSRQHEKRYLEYYGYPHYWWGTGLWGEGATMLTGLGCGGTDAEDHKAKVEQGRPLAQPARRNDHDPHLRSCNEVMGYHIQATDGDIGHVQGLLVDEETWAIRYIVVDTSNWWLGHRVVIAPQWIRGVSWPNATVSVNLTRQAVKEAPPYDSEVQLNRNQETGIHEHYGRPGYWMTEVREEITSRGQ